MISLAIPKDPNYSLARSLNLPSFTGATMAMLLSIFENVDSASPATSFLGEVGMGKMKALV